MKILDATCGAKGIWYQKNHPFVTFMDKRRGTFSKRAVSKGCKIVNDRKFNIYPDVISEWKNAPFPDNHFDMVIFDPPHLMIDKGKKKSGMMVQYGHLKSAFIIPYPSFIKTF